MTARASIPAKRTAVRQFKSADDGKPRYRWQPVDREDLPDYIEIIATSVAERQRWRTHYELAKERAGPNPGSNSATHHAA